MRQLGDGGLYLMGRNSPRDLPALANCKDTDYEVGSQRCPDPVFHVLSLDLEAFRVKNNACL